MPDPNMTILYVDNPPASAAFYGELLEKTPVESGPTFAAFALGSGTMLGLWSKHTVVPAATGIGGCEVGFSVESNAVVDSLYADWKARGLPILQEVSDVDFGRTFVALDPDGHRLRVYTLA